MPETSRRIRLEIDEQQGALHGRVAEADGATHEFEGWLGLLTPTVSLRCNEQAGESLFVEDAKITALQVETVVGP